MEITNLTALRMFADVIATGSFTAAADVHGVTQPAVSFHLRQLEAGFGVPLIAREGRRAIPTSAGAELLRHIADIDAAVAATVHGMQAFAEQETGSLRIGTGSTACTTLLPSVLRLSRQSLPGVELSVITGNSPQIAQALTDRKIDIGLVSLPVHHRVLETTPLFDDEIVCVAPARMPLPDPVTPSSLLPHPSMMFESAHVTRSLIDGWFQQAGLRFHPSMTVGSLEAIRELIGMNMGYALISQLALPETLIGPNLVVRSLAPKLHRTIGYAIRRDQPRTRSIEVFIAALERQTRGFSSS